MFDQHTGNDQEILNIDLCIWKIPEDLWQQQEIQESLGNITIDQRE